MSIRTDTLHFHLERSLCLTKKKKKIRENKQQNALNKFSPRTSYSPSEYIYITTYIILYTQNSSAHFYVLISLVLHKNPGSPRVSLHLCRMPSAEKPIEYVCCLRRSSGSRTRNPAPAGEMAGEPGIRGGGGWCTPYTFFAWFGYGVSRVARVFPSFSSQRQRVLWTLECERTRERLSAILQRRRRWSRRWRRRVSLSLCEPVPVPHHRRWFGVGSFFFGEGEEGENGGRKRNVSRNVRGRFRETLSGPDGYGIWRSNMNMLSKNIMY